MTYSICWLEEAEADVLDMALYVAETFGRRVANQVVDQIDDGVCLVSYTPFIGSVYDGRPDFRVLHSKKSSIYYRILEKEILVVAVIDNRRNPLHVDTLLDRRHKQ